VRVVLDRHAFDQGLTVTRPEAETRTLRLWVSLLTVTVAAGAAAPRLVKMGVAVGVSVMPSGTGILPAPSVPAPIQTPEVWQFACRLRLIPAGAMTTETEQFS